MAKKICLVNMKGGVGKSTLCVQLAFEFAILTKWAKSVLVIDLDPQFNTSQYLLGASEYDSKILKKDFPTAWNIFEQHTRIPGLRVPPRFDPRSAIFPAKNYSGGSKIDLVASRLELAFSLRHQEQKEHLISKFVNVVEKDYDIIFIDCPPTESLFTTAAYEASDFVLVPVRPEYLSAIGLPLLDNSLEEFNENNGTKPKVAGVVFNFTQNYAPEELRSRKEVRDVCLKYRWNLFKNDVPYSRSFAKSAREGQPLRWTSYSRMDRIARLTAVADELAGAVGI